MPYVGVHQSIEQHVLYCQMYHKINTPGDVPERVTHGSVTLETAIGQQSAKSAHLRAEVN